MIKKTHILSIILCIAMVLSFIPRQEVSAKSKKVSVTKSLTLKVGQSKTIKVKGSYIKSKKYKTSKKRIATVSKKGKVTAKKAGTCKITVTVKYKKSKKAKKYTTKKYTCKVTVTKKATTVPTKHPVTAKPTNNNIKPTPTPIPTKAPVTQPTEQPDKPVATNPVIPTPSVPTVIQPDPGVGDEILDADFTDKENKYCHHKYPGVNVKWTKSSLDNHYYISEYPDFATMDWYVNEDELVPICNKCNKPALFYTIYNDVYQSDFVYDLPIRFYNGGDKETYSVWGKEPSETEEGILEFYQGVNIYDMTEEQLQKNYKKYNVTFPDGTKDVFYCLENRLEGSLETLNVVAKSTAEKIGSVSFPKYEVKTIDLGNGQTTKVYGYYDREMANEVFNMVNEYRVENGLNELDHNDITQNFADIRSPETFYTYIYNQQNTDYEYKPHERPNKTMPDTVIKDIAYNGFGENSLMHTIIEDYQAGGIFQKVEMTPENIMQSFKDSFEHNSIMLDPEFTDLSVSIFIGYPQNKDGTFKSYKVGIPVQSFMH